MADTVLKPPTITGGRKITSPVLTRLTMLVYGQSGSGKTHLIRTIVEDPRMLPCLVLVCDEGQASIIDLVNETTFIIHATPTLDDIDKVLNELVNQQPYFKTMVIDNISVAHHSALLKAARDRVNTRSRGNDAVLEQSDYGVARNEILATVGNLVYHPFFARTNIIMTAQSATSQDEATGVRTWDVGCPGKVANELPGFFDVVGFIRRESPDPIEVQRAQRAGTEIPTTVTYLQVSQTRTILSARNRGGKLGDSIINPIIPNIVALYKSKSTTATSAV